MKQIINTLIVAVALSMALNQSSAKTIHVPGDSATIQAGINGCSEGDTVLVGLGEYFGVGNRDINFFGKAVTLLSGDGAKNTIINCNGSVSFPRRAFIFQNNEGLNTIIDGFTITQGYQDNGGAIYCQNASPTIRNCIFENNSATNGGGIYTNYQITLNNCVFKNNSASAGGGAIRSGKIILETCLFINNSSAKYGGCIINSGNLTANNCTFSGNSADSNGSVISSGIYTYDTFYACIMSFNGANDLIDCNNTILYVSCCDMYGNEGGDWEGCLLFSEGINNNISMDPFYCDVAKEDYRVSPSSPCAPLNNACGILIGACESSCEAVTWHVDTAGNDTTGDGSLTKPFATIQRALDEASDQEVVLVHNGIYSGEGNYSITPHLNKIHIKTENGPEFTIIDIEGNNFNAFDISDYYADADTNTVIEGFTIKNAYIGINIASACGVRVINVDFENNSNSGIYNQLGGWPKHVKSCQFTENGHGIFSMSGSNYYIDSCNFINNSGTAVHLDYGGGTGEVNDSYFESNGIGINSRYTEYPEDFTINNCRFTKNDTAIYGTFKTVNSAFSKGSVGLSAYVGPYYASYYEVENCVFDSIIGTVIEAGYYSRIDNSTFNNNFGQIAYIAAPFEEFSKLTLNHCKISNNGGGINSDDSYAYLTMSHCVYENSGSINLGGSYEGRIYIDNSIFSYNLDTLINISSYDCSTKVSNCLFYKNNFVIKVADNANIRNNTITNNSGGALVISEGAIELDRNIITYNDGYGITAPLTYISDFDISNCNIYGNQAGNYDTTTIRDQTGKYGNISSDPLFCDISTSDYSISWWSPCSPYMNDSGLIGALGIECENPNYEDLVSIYIDPPDMIISCQDSLQFGVKGVYADSSEEDVSAWVDWAISNPMIASIDNKGMVCGENTGICSLLVQLVDFSDTSSLTVKSNIDHEEIVIPVLDTSRCLLTVTVSGNPEVYLFYRQGGEVEYDSILMQLSDTSFVGMIPEDIIGLSSIDYYFLATENEISATLPEYNPQNEPFVLRLEFSEQHGITLPGGVYRMIGFPFEVDPNDPNSVFTDELGIMNDRDWRLGHWNQDKEDYDKNNEIDAIDWGQGYWLWTKNRKGIGAGGISAAPDVTLDSIRYALIPLSPGWNQISTPFAFDISWPGCLTTNELIEDPQKYISGFGYDAEYDMADVLEPFQGYWINNYSVQAETLFVPYQRYIAGSGKIAANENKWQVRLILESGSALDRNNIIGFRSDAQEGYDKYDISEPPPIGRFVSLAFLETGSDGRRCNLTHNIKPTTSDGWQYDIRVCGNTGEPVQLKIESQSLPSGYYVIFEDPISHNRYDLLKDKTLILPQIPIETGSQYRLFIGSSEYLKNENVTLLAKPGDFRIHQNYPNPFNAITTINYELPKTSRVSLSIYNILGQKVKTLTDVMQPHGYYSITWDGTNDNGQVVSSGIYYYRLNAGDYAKTRKLLLLK